MTPRFFDLVFDHEFSFQFIDDLDEQNVRFTRPLGSIVATVCQWMHDAQNEPRRLAVISILLDV
jgi:hypothetical protein